MTTEMRRSAVISHCDRYRYTLVRDWSGCRNLLAWVMLNPSTADASVDDPTVRRVAAFTRGWGYGGFVVVNLFAYRATEPGELGGVEDPVGGENDAAILSACSCRRVVCAWGAWRSSVRSKRPVIVARVPHVLGLLEGVAMDAVCLGVTGDGSPRHPLYVKGSQEPVPFPLA